MSERTEFRIPEQDTLKLTEAQMELPEFHAMLDARVAADKARKACPDLIAAEDVYNKAWDALAAKVR